MEILNKYNDPLNNSIHSLDDGSDTETSAKVGQIYKLNNNISSLGKEKQGLNDKRNFMKTRHKGIGKVMRLHPSF